MDAPVGVRLPLLLLRLGVFVVMFMGTLDKFLNPKYREGGNAESDMERRCHRRKRQV